jgi:hypothetical protein
MQGTVRTSQTDWTSAEGCNGLCGEGERNRFDEFSLVFNENAAMMRGQSGHDVLPFQFSADEVFGAVKLNASLRTDLADPGNQALRKRQRHPALAVEIGIESEAGRKMTEGRPESVPEDTRKAGFMLGHREAAAGLAEVIIIQESIAGPPQHTKVRAAVPKNPGLPNVIEALHGCVSAGLFRGDEEKMDPEKQMEPDDLGEAVAIPASSRGGHLVVHLGELRQAHKTPGINEMDEQGDRALVPELMGRGRLAHGIDGVEGIEAGDPTRASQMTGSNQVGLLQIAHLPGWDIGIERSAGWSPNLDFFGLAGPSQDLLDGRDGRQPTRPAPMKLEMDRLGANAGESRPPSFVGHQFVAKSQDLADNGLWSPVPEMLGRATPILQPFQTEGFITADPLGQPEAASLDFAQNLFKTNSFVEKTDRLAAPFIFEGALHRPDLLPFGMGKSLGDAKSVCDVLTVF